jgi:hypothetical protein
MLTQSASGLDEASAHRFSLRGLSISFDRPSRQRGTQACDVHFLNLRAGHGLLVI